MEQRNTHPALTDFGAPYSYSVGSKYNGYRDLADIAKDVRADIKAVKAEGHFPKALKVSVRISRYSGGQSLNVDITAVPEGEPVLNPERLAASIAAPHDFDAWAWRPRFTEAVNGWIDRLKAIVGAYNYDRSDIQTDYFDVNFYSNVGVHWELLRDKEREGLGAVSG